MLTIYANSTIHDVSMCVSVCARRLLQKIAAIYSIGLRNKIQNAILNHRCIPFSTKFGHKPELIYA